MNGIPRIAHGGDLDQAKRWFGTPANGWIDLSTGINSIAYPVPSVPLTAWTQLPQRDAEASLLAAARQAYNVDRDADLLAAPGTQALIQAVPRLTGTPGRVAVISPTYAEHAASWSRVGHLVDPIPDLAGLEPERHTALVVVNPNNPDGRQWAPADIVAATRDLRANGGLVVVDEAFADVAPESTSTPHAGKVGMIVLRSFGKFYGLAGLRLGLAAASPETIRALAAEIGPWAVSGPALEIGRTALLDQGWASRARAALALDRQRLDALLAMHGLTVVGGTDLFRLIRHDDAAGLQTALARHGIWTRIFADQPTWLRLGMVRSASDLDQLDKALNRIVGGGW